MKGEICSEEEIEIIGACCKMNRTAGSTVLVPHDQSQFCLISLATIVRLNLNPN